MGHCFLRGNNIHGEKTHSKSYHGGSIEEKATDKCRKKKKRESARAPSQFVSLEKKLFKH